MMNRKEFMKAVAEGKNFWMSKYSYNGNYSTPQLVSAERALAKSKVRTFDGWPPYRFEVAK